MAKRKPTLTLEEMERELGYKVDPLIHPTESVERFYSDLSPVPTSAYEKTKREFEHHGKRKYRKGFEAISEEVLPELGVAKVRSRRGGSVQANLFIDNFAWSGHHNTHVYE